MEKNISMLDVALKILTDAKTSLPFRELYDKIAEELKMTDSEKKENIGIFYTYLTLDGHFVALTDNHWDLRSRHTFDKVHIDVRDVYSEVNTESGDEEDKDEQKEYDGSMEGMAVEDEYDSENDEEKHNEYDEDVSSLINN
jgi:DNA-directed RNA polymerase subunit delta